MEPSSSLQPILRLFGRYHAVQSTLVQIKSVSDDLCEVCAELDPACKIAHRKRQQLLVLVEEIDTKVEEALGSVAAVLEQVQNQLQPTQPTQTQTLPTVIGSGAAETMDGAASS